MAGYYKSEVIVYTINTKERADERLLPMFQVKMKITADFGRAGRLFLSFVTYVACRERQDNKG